MRILLIIVMLLLSGQAWAGVTTLYPTSDTKLNPAATTTNYDTATTCGSTAWDGTACLFVFDLSGISASDIIAANLRLGTDSGRGGQHGMSYFRITTPWTSSQATWAERSTGLGWGTSGALNSSQDYTTVNATIRPDPDPNSVPGSAGQYYTSDVTELVKDMIDNNNYGFAVRRLAGMYITWRMSEYSGTTWDPRLSIQTGTPGATNTWYVRPNGGTCGLDNQCTGFTNADFVSGINGDCACALPSQAAGQAAGEDTIIVTNGTYNDSGVTLPVGTSTTARTKLYGEGYANCTDVAGVTIWANTHGANIVGLNDYTDLRCLTITDHSGGGDSDIADNTETGYSNNGINIANDSTGVFIENVDVYGLYRGLVASRLGDMTTNNLRLVGNWSVGWDSDVNSDDGYTGLVTNNNITIAFNGCATKYPLANSSDLLDTDNFQYCCTQSQNCYGDGIGLGDGTLGNWIFNGGNVSFNTSDGLDTLHGTGAGAYQYVRNMRTEGNVGQQLKITAADGIVEDSKIIGSCTYFDDKTFKATALQASSLVGRRSGYPFTGYATLTGTGITKTAESIGTGNGVATTFSGSLAFAPLKDSSPFAVVSYTQGGVARTATSGAFGGSSSNMRGSFIGTGISHAGDSGTNYVVSYVDYRSGAYQLTFTTAPDNTTPITITYVYVDAVPSGTFTGDRTVQGANSYNIEVDGNGTPDTFKWRVTTGGVVGSYTTGVAMTGSAQTLADGVAVQFETTTGHTIGDVYTFTTLGYDFGHCRAVGTPITISMPASGTMRFTNNTVYSIGDISLFQAISSGSCNGTERIYSRNNIYINGEQCQSSYGGGCVGNPGDLVRMFYTESSGCTTATLFDSDYDAACSGQILGDCTGEGANNVCYASCAGNPLGFTTAPTYSDPYYTGDNMDITLAVGSSSRDAADETVTAADAFDMNYYARGASWDIGALEYGSVQATCSDGIENGLEEGADCGGVCLTACAGSPAVYGLIGNVRFIGDIIKR